MCLNFPQFEPEVAYKTLAYKKKKCSLNMVGKREGGICHTPLLSSVVHITKPYCINMSTMYPLGQFCWVLYPVLYVRSFDERLIRQGEEMVAFL